MTGNGDVPGGPRVMALASALVLIGSFLTGFLKLTRLFGGTEWLAGYVALAIVAGTLLGWRLPLRRGLIGAGLVLAVGVAGYLVLLPPVLYDLFTPVEVLEDVYGWLTGRSAVLMLQADLWAVSVAPAPTFLTWYLAVRGRYDGAALAGGAALGFFVLTGDATEAVTLVGFAAALGMLGFGAIEESEADIEQVQEVGFLVGVAMLLGSLVRVVPARGLVTKRGSGSGGSLEESVVGDRNRVRVRGRVSLSPEPRYRIEADRGAYWRVRSFDHYTGSGWRRTFENAGAAAPLTPPPGETATVQQKFVAQTDVSRVPYAWKPVLLGSKAQNLASVDRLGELESRRPVTAGESYTVISAVPTWDAETLRSAGEDYPDSIERRYLQVPEDLPDRLVAKADEIAAGAETPYDVAVAVQGWLKSNKSYSLNVSRPAWDVADAFVFAMDEGYCVYFATTMTVLLRTQGVPARFVSGYAPGESVDDGEWLVRGLHSHTWVEVYFPEVGWIPFDPTPGDARQDARDRRMEEAESSGGAGSGGEAGTGTATPTATATPTPAETATPADTNGSSGSTNGSSPAGVQGALRRGTPPERFTEEGAARTPNVGAVQSSGDATTPTPTPTPSGGGGGRSDRLWIIGAIATLAFGSARLGYAQSAVRSVWLRWQPRTDSPGTDVERALERLEYHLGRTFREREEGETRLQYVRAAVESEAIDRRALRVLELYHRSRFGDGIGGEEADEAIRVVDELVR